MKAKRNKTQKQLIETDQKKEKIRHRYIFPNFLASAMKNADIKTQLQASMMSMFLLLVGMILMGIYSVIYLTQGWIFKGLVIFNIAAGFLFMTSYLVTTYQQYVSYMAAVEVQNNMENIITPKRKKNRLNQFLFFVGLLFMITGLALYFTMTDTNANIGYVGLGLAAIGFIMIVTVFLRPNSKNKQNKELPPAIPQASEELQQQWKENLDEIDQQEELNQMETGIDQYTNEAINPQYDSPQEEYVDYTQPESEQPQPINPNENKRRFRGRDGRYYYQS